MTKEEAQRILPYIQNGLISQEWKDWEYPQYRIPTVKNQKSSSAYAEERGEKRGKSDNPLTD